MDTLARAIVVNWGQPERLLRLAFLCALNTAMLKNLPPVVNPHHSALAFCLPSPYIHSAIHMESVQRGLSGTFVYNPQKMRNYRNFKDYECVQNDRRA